MQIRVDVNTQRRNLEVDADASALTVVREQLGLRGAKLACGHGACGACTMLVDGAPVAGCLLPATSLHGRALTTVEGLASSGALRWKGHSPDAEVGERHFAFARNQVPYTCLRTCQPWGPDDEPAVPEGCDAARPCFEAPTVPVA